jgi:hypothetical protein
MSTAQEINELHEASLQMCNIEDNFWASICTGQFSLALHWAHAFLTVARS